MNQQLRQPAYIVHCKDLLTGQFVKESGWNPSYVLVAQVPVSRINIIGTVIAIQDTENGQTLQFDDGTSPIAVKSFDKKIDVSVGDVVLIVGRVRQYGSERYITPEIIKKNIDRRWGLVWKRHALEQTESLRSEPLTKEIAVHEEVPPANNNLAIIKELDDGNGADYEAVVRMLSEKEIKHLLMNGEVFEVRPGKLKVLD